MMKPPAPLDEARRLEVLRSLRVLDTPQEEGFDRLTRLARIALKTPIALVSLVDGDRQWFKSKQGLEACETPREVSFCGHAILTPATFVVSDATLDARFADNPLVTGPPHVRFYAGAPLTVDGQRIGTLCVIDHVPRAPATDELALLRDLADCVEQQLVQSEFTRSARGLRDLEARQRAVLDNVVDGIITIDERGVVQTVNPAVSTLFGHAPEEMVGQNVKMLMPASYAREHDGYLGNYLTTGKRKVIGIGREVTGQRKDGSQFPLELAVSEVWLQGQRMFTGIVRDMSERHAAQRELKQFKATLDQTRDGIFMFWPDTLRFFYVNHGASLQVGFSRDELLGKSALELKTEFTEATYRAKVAPLVAGPLRSITFETVHRHQSGALVPVEVFLQYVQPEGEPPRFVNIVRDISERKAAERRLREVTVVRQAILDSANASIISTDPAGIIRTFSRGAEAMLGYAADELIGQRDLGLLHEPAEIVERGRVLTAELGTPIEPGFESFVARARRGEVDENEWAYVRKDGSRVPVMLSVTAMRDDRGEIFGFLCIATDITERKKLDRMKTEFVSTVSHELRTPLTSIRGALGLVLGKASSELSPKVKTLLETANRNAERLTLLINDILDLEKIESGRMQFTFKPLDLVALTRQAITANDAYAKQYDVSLALVDAPEAAMISGDDHRLGQVFSNLLSNAVKYSPAGGRVEVRVTARDGRYRVSVRDRGRGIPESFRAQVFERFAQADSSDSRDKGGTGLGLSITRAIVDKHQGAIDYASTLGEGTEFWFEVPAWNDRVEQPSTESRPLLLICEDNSDVSTVLSELLANEGLASDVAGTASAAMELLDKKAYRALLLDLGLPDADGLELIREIRQRKGLEDLPILVVSGRARDGQATGSRDAVSVADWIQKPVDEERLAIALRRAMGRGGRARVLHVEDDLDVVQVAKSILAEIADLDFAPTLAEARRKLEGTCYDVVLLDLTLPDGNGLDLLEAIGRKTQVVVFSGQEAGEDVTRRVATALTKSKTSNETLVETIRGLINQEKRA